MIFLTKIIFWGEGGGGRGGMKGDGVSDFFYYESKFKIIFWGRGGGTVGLE